MYHVLECRPHPEVKFSEASFILLDHWFVVHREPGGGSKGHISNITLLPYLYTTLAGMSQK